MSLVNLGLHHALSGNRKCPRDQSTQQMPTGTPQNMHSLDKDTIHRFFKDIMLSDLIPSLRKIYEHLEIWGKQKLGIEGTCTISKIVGKQPDLKILRAPVDLWKFL